MATAARYRPARKSRYTRLDGRIYYLDSQLEVSFAQWLDRHGYDWWRSSRQLSNATHRWSPDFIIESSIGRLYIEVKPTREHMLVETVEAMASVSPHQVRRQRDGLTVPCYPVVFIGAGTGEWWYVERPSGHIALASAPPR